MLYDFKWTGKKLASNSHYRFIVRGQSHWNQYYDMYEQAWDQDLTQAK